MEKKEFALLDADFIIKAIISRKAEDNCLLDYLASNTKYQLVCHEMALKEISIHDYYSHFSTTTSEKSNSRFSTTKTTPKIIVPAREFFILGGHLLV